MALNRIRGGEIRVGEPLPWPVTDDKGTLLLRKGYVISSKAQLDVLVQKGVYADTSYVAPPASPVPPADAAKPSPFEFLDGFQLRLKRLCEDLKAGVQGDLPDRITQYCKDVQQLCRMDSDAVLGAVHLIHNDRYTVVHGLHTAILTELFLRTMGIAAEDRLPILAAALTHDIGMMDLHEELNRQATPLTDVQWATIRQHPLRSVDMLEAVGVMDGVWLDTVLHHHERLDGSGYPDGLLDEDIFFPVRVLAIADIYSAMIKRRAYREPLLAKEALRDIFLQRAGRVDEHLTKIFVKELGIFPPGAFVRLNNGEIAVVVHRGKNGSCPVVQTVVGPRGAPLPRPIRRDTGVGEFAIKDMVPRDGAVSVSLRSLWGYS
jgi:hypothetical protein